LNRVLARSLGQRLLRKTPLFESEQRIPARIIKVFLEKTEKNGLFEKEAITFLELMKRLSTRI